MKSKQIKKASKLLQYDSVKRRNAVLLNDKQLLSLNMYMLGVNENGGVGNNNNDDSVSSDCSGGVFDRDIDSDNA